MKLATLRDGSRDGQLAVVSRDLRSAQIASTVAGTLQRALDDWAFCAPQLAELAQALDDGRARHAFAFDPARCMAPLPRAYQWADGSAYVNHIELVRRARGAPLPERLRSDPLLYQGGSDDLAGARDDIVCADLAWGLDFEAEVAVIVDDVAAGSTPAAAAERIRLLLLANDVSLRHLIPGELAKGFGFFQSKPATAFSPVAVTPDELGAAWDGRRLALPLLVDVNGRRVGQADAGEGLAFDFPQLIAHACRTRRLGAGTIIGSGTVSNADPARGYSCIAEQRAREIIAGGAAVTPFLAYGDCVKIEMRDAQGASVFGALEQRVVAAR